MLRPKILPRVLLALVLNIATSTLAQQVAFTGLFQNKFFTLSQGAELICTTSAEGQLPVVRLRQAIAYYESFNPGLRDAAVAFLTRHTNLDHLTEIRHIKRACAKQHKDALCLLEGYWDDTESALRVLALFYDTKTVIKHNNDYDYPRFEADHIHSFEKALRKIPPFMRRFITQAKPLGNLDDAFKKATIPRATQQLILDAYPEDAETRIWLDGSQPLSIIPGTGFRDQVVAQVYSGSNNIIFTIKNFDKAKDGQSYRDIGLTYLVDFRIPLIVHELGHVIDNFHFWDGKEELYFFFWYRKLSTDIIFVDLIKDSELALWPSHWFSAFEYLWEVNNGRYNGKINEKLAELFAQYILIPGQLKTDSPNGYAWLRDDIFKGIEYQGYESCPNPVVRKLSWWESATARALGK
ncbi:MAG: hypothetical protein CVV13_09210 [Gammaproteobacteria bacterium HGW-Gammaproteobacteria-3]|nr:MAG: hypothetical protein CVV13_09210 [Gammaproteobacteria bacterium HGW-Gammaproteobacteria-3]